MSRKGFKIILQQVLNRSPQRQLDRFQKICFSVPVAHYKLAEDAYLDKNLSDIYCDYLLTAQFKSFPNTSSLLLDSAIKIQNSILQANEKQNFCDEQIEEKLISVSKKLQDSKHTHDIYYQAYQLVDDMSEGQVSQNKQYLMYIYRWTLNQKGRVNPDIEELTQGLKIKVIQKLSEAYANTQESKQIENELNKLQILANARQCKLKGEHQKAKLNYELVYRNIKNSEPVRIEALEYLCKNSQQNSDEGYLRNIMLEIIAQNGQYKHIKYVQRSISQIIENIRVQAMQSHTSPQITQQ